MSKKSESITENIFRDFYGVKTLFENDSKIILDVKAQIDTTDKEIDKMVYEFYGLNDDKIKIVEGI